jgi:hypothetical protein
MTNTFTPEYCIAHARYAAEQERVAAPYRREWRTLSPYEQNNLMKEIRAVLDALEAAGYERPTEKRRVFA